MGQAVNLGDKMGMQVPLTCVSAAPVLSLRGYKRS